MNYLVDTDIASYYLRGLHSLLAVFQKKGVSEIRLSVVTVAELKVLAYKNPRSKVNLRTIQELAATFGTLDCDEKTWDTYAKLKAAALKRGRKRGDLDFLQASIAKRRGLTVVTNNESHYKDLVRVENWVTSR